MPYACACFRHTAPAVNLVNIGAKKADHHNMHIVKDCSAGERTCMQQLQHVAVNSLPSFDWMSVVLFALRVFVLSCSLKVPTGARRIVFT
jgi:hypothetical protein